MDIGNILQNIQHVGWLLLDIGKRCSRCEIYALIIISYIQYALLYSDIFTSSLNKQKAIFDSIKHGGWQAISAAIFKLSVKKIYSFHPFLCTYNNKFLSSDEFKCFASRPFPKGNPINATDLGCMYKQLFRNLLPKTRLDTPLFYRKMLSESGPKM